MEELKNLTTEQLKKVIEEVNKELRERKNEERKKAYKNLINAMKDFQKTEFFDADNCYFEVYCDECGENTEAEFFDIYDSIIEALEREI